VIVNLLLPGPEIFQNTIHLIEEFLRIKGWDILGVGFAGILLEERNLVLSGGCKQHAK